jgi:hypothetical protein
MGWSDEVHASRVQSAPRKKQSQGRFQGKQPNAGLIPIAVVAAAGAGTLLARRNGVNLLGDGDPLARLGAFLQRLLGGGGRKLSNGKRKSGTTTQWKSSRPQDMAAAAASARAQVSGDHIRPASPQTFSHAFMFLCRALHKHQHQAAAAVAARRRRRRRSETTERDPSATPPSNY